MYSISNQAITEISDLLLWFVCWSTLCRKRQKLGLVRKWNHKRKNFVACWWLMFRRWPGPSPAWNTRGGERGFLRWAEFFSTTSKRFELYPIHFSWWGEETCRGGIATLRGSPVLAQVCTAPMLSKSKKILMILNSKQKRLYQLATAELLPNETRKQQKNDKSAFGSDALD